MWICSKKHNREQRCTRCLVDRAEQVRRMTGRRKEKLQMSVDDFIELGEAYFWFLDIIDPFTGMFS